MGKAGRGHMHVHLNGEVTNDETQWYQCTYLQVKWFHRTYQCLSVTISNCKFLQRNAIAKPESHDLSALGGGSMDHFSCVAERWKGHTNSRISKAGTLREQHGSKPILGPLDHCIGEVKEVSISPPILNIYVSYCIFFFGWLTPRFNEYTMISPTLAMLCVHPRTISQSRRKSFIRVVIRASFLIRSESFSKYLVMLAV